MSNFLKLIQEATPESNTTDNTDTGQLAANANKPAKKGGIICLLYTSPSPRD